MSWNESSTTRRTFSSGEAKYTAEGITFRDASGRIVDPRSFFSKSELETFARKTRQLKPDWRRGSSHLQLSQDCRSQVSPPFQISAGRMTVPVPANAFFHKTRCSDVTRAECNKISACRPRDLYKYEFDPRPRSAGCSSRRGCRAFESSARNRNDTDCSRNAAMTVTITCISRAIAELAKERGARLNFA